MADSKDKGVGYASLDTQKPSTISNKAESSRWHRYMANPDALTRGLDYNPTADQSAKHIAAALDDEKTPDYFQSLTKEAVADGRTRDAVNYSRAAQALRTRAGFGGK